MAYKYADKIYSQEDIANLENIKADLETRIAHATNALANPDRLRELSIKAHCGPGELQKRWGKILAQSQAELELAQALLE